jgi:hypothetical protein
MGAGAGNRSLLFRYGALLLNALVPLRRFRLCTRRGHEPSHDVVQQKLQPEDRRSQIIGESIRLAIHPIPAADQTLERQRELALRSYQNLLGSRLIKAHKALFG